MKPDIIENLSSSRDDEGPISHRVAWFVTLWLVSVATLTIVGMTIKWMIG
jgi:hypothetical protein